MRGTEANKNPEPSRGLERIQKGRDSWRRRRDCAALRQRGRGRSVRGSVIAERCRARALCVPPLGPPLVPCRRCRSLVGRGFGQRRSVLPQRVFTPRIGVCCFSLHRFYRHQHRRLYFTVLHLSFTSVGVCTSAVCTRPMTERTVGSTARNDERLHVSLAGRSLFGYAPVGWVFVHRQMCGRSNVPRTGQCRAR